MSANVSSVFVSTVNLWEPAGALCPQWVGGMGPTSKGCSSPRRLWHWQVRPGSFRQGPPQVMGGPPIYIGARTFCSTHSGCSWRGFCPPSWLISWVLCPPRPSPSPGALHGPRHSLEANPSEGGGARSVSYSPHDFPAVGTSPVSLPEPVLRTGLHLSCKGHQGAA